MKKIFFTLIVFTIAFTSLIAQDNKNEGSSSDRLRYYKEKYEETFNAPFEVVWASVKDIIKNMGAQISQQKTSQDDSGLWKGVIRTDNYIFTEGQDSSYRIHQRYQYNMIYVPGGLWDNGRVNYKVILKETSVNNVSMVLVAELSGLETHVSGEYHFWKSNGLLEKQFIDQLKEIVQKKTKK